MYKACLNQHPQNFVLHKYICQNIYIFFSFTSQEKTWKWQRFFSMNILYTLIKKMRSRIARKVSLALCIPFPFAANNNRRFLQRSRIHDTEEYRRHFRGGDMRKIPKNRPTIIKPLRTTPRIVSVADASQVR